MIQTGLEEFSTPLTRIRVLPISDPLFFELYHYLRISITISYAL